MQPKRWLILILAVSVTARIGSALLMGDRVEVLPGIYDQVSYHTLATRLLGGYGFTFDQMWWPVTPAGQPTAFWSYLYTFYLVGVYAIFGIHPLAARLIQAIAAGILMPWMVYRLAKRVFTSKHTNAETIGLMAAGWTAVYGYFVYYAGALMTETFYTIGILWILDCGLKVADCFKKEYVIKRQDWLGLGLAIGLTAMLRQVVLLFIPFLFLWLVWVRLAQAHFWPACWKVVKGGLLSLLVMTILIIPITLFNYRQFGRFVLLNNNAGYAFFWANNPVEGYVFKPLYTSDMPTYQEVIPPELRSLNEAELDQALMKLGWGFVFENPLRYLSLTITRIPQHFVFWPLPESGLISNLTRVGSFGLALPFMLIGLFLWGRSQCIGDNFFQKLKVLSFSSGSLLVLFFLVYTSMHILSWSGIRYRLPQDAVMLAFAGYGLLWSFIRITRKIAHHG